MKTTKRMAQIAEQIRHTVATLIVTNQISDPRLRQVTIQSVRVSPDLQQAKIYYTVLGGEKAKNAAKEALSKAKGFIRKHVGAYLQIFHAPELVFFYDEVEERANRIHSLLSEIQSESQSRLESNEWVHESNIPN